MDYFDEIFDEFDEDINVTKEELYGSRHARYIKRVNAENHLRKIEPYTMSVRVTRNGGIIRKGDTYSWLQEWKKADRRVTRHSGKATCRNWQAQLLDESREFVPDEDALWEEEQIAHYNENGHWDVESQSFVWNKSREPVNTDDWDDTPSYFIPVRRWNDELRDHVIEYIPNPEYAYYYLVNKGLRDDFVSWLKAKEARVC